MHGRNCFDPVGGGLMFSNLATDVSCMLMKTSQMLKSAGGFVNLQILEICISYGIIPKPGTSKASKVINAASAKAMMDAALEEVRLFMLLNRTSNPIPILQIPYCYATKNVHIFIKISAQK